MQSLAQQFKSYLEGSKLSDVPKFRTLSPTSIKNYVSDVSQFLNWLSTASNQKTLQPKHITRSSCQAYRQHLQNSLSSLSLTTANRHLSSLRHFCRYLQSSNQLNHNPSLNLPNLDISSTPPSQTQVINLFSKFLKSQKLASSTIKNYLSDINQYLLWVQNNIKLTDSKITSRIS